MMKSIEITRNGAVVSRVHFGETVAEAAALMKGNLFLIYDRAAARYAVELGRVVPFAGAYALDGVSEETKTMETVQGICRWLLDAGANRDAVVVAVGGGILTDVAGFAASIYKRGVRTVYVPTTLLAQVDAAIGGKTGVNLDAFKNIVGTFHQPEHTYICPEVLETLPEAVFRSGLAEMLKTFVIGHGDGRLSNGRCAEAAKCGGQNGCEKNGESESNGLGSDGGEYKVSGLVDEMTEAVRQIDEAGGFAVAGSDVRSRFGNLVAEAAAIKAGIVSRDEFEGGERRKLNLGHTFAHAIEYVANSCGSQKCDSGKARQRYDDALQVSHGEAVAMGLTLAARLSVKLGLASEDIAEKIIGAVHVCGLPVECPFPLALLEDAMLKDKKAAGDKIHFVLPAGIGNVVIRDLSPAEAIDLLINSDTNN